MKKTIKFCLILGSISLVLSMILEFNLWVMLDQLIILSAMGFALFFCKNKMDYRIMGFFSLWVTAYNMIYILLKFLNVIDLYEVPWRISIQIIIPFVVALILRRARETNNNTEYK